jgi:hypothetical protein
MCVRRCERKWKNQTSASSTKGKRATRAEKSSFPPPHAAPLFRSNESITVAMGWTQRQKVNENDFRRLATSMSNFLANQAMIKRIAVRPYIGNGIRVNHDDGEESSPTQAHFAIIIVQQ